MKKQSYLAASLLIILIVGVAHAGPFVSGGGSLTGCTNSAGDLTCTSFTGDGTGLTGVTADGNETQIQRLIDADVPDGNDTEINRLATSVKANAASPVSATTGTFATTFSAGAGGMTVDADGDVTAKSVTVTKVANTASVNTLFNDNGTQTIGFSWKGPHQTTAQAADFIWQVPTGEPSAGQVMAAGTVASNTTTATWVTPMLSTGAGLVERLGVTFDGGGSAIADNSTAYVHVPFAATINQWTVVCKEDSGTTGMIVDMYKDAYAADTLPTTTMCTTGSPPHTTDGAGAGGLVHQAAWDCNVATITADDIIKFKVTTPPSDATWCTVTLKVTR